MSLFPLLRPLIHALDGENAHLATINLLRLVPFLTAPAPHPMLATRVAGLSLPGPVGLAASFIELSGQSGSVSSPCARNVEMKHPHHKE